MDKVPNDGCKRSTVAEVYAQIMSDLNNAVKLFEATTMTREDKRYADLAHHKRWDGHSGVYIRFVPYPGKENKCNW
jgi:hypothetical protein